MAILLPSRENYNDSLFYQELEEIRPSINHNPSKADLVATSYFDALANSITSLNQMFSAPSLEQRVKGSSHFMQIRKEFSKQLFIEAVRPQIESLLIKHGEVRSFDEIITIFGFNRLFIREIGSAGTDIDFFILVDTENDSLISDIQTLMRREIQPIVNVMGIDMETASYLMIKKSTYMEKLSNTKCALFTLANRNSIDFIAGSRENLTDAFTFTDEQIAHHLVTLLSRHNLIREDQKGAIRSSILVKISSEPERENALFLLKQMANAEIYIGKTPYSNKKTIQTELKKISKTSIENREAIISIKYNFNRIADLYKIVDVDPDYTILSLQEIETLEKLSMILSNIKCRVDDESHHPLLKIQQNYSDLSLLDIKKMTIEDRKVISNILESYQLDPEDELFPEMCYDALWDISKKMGSAAELIEAEIYSKALTFCS